MNYKELKAWHTSQRETSLSGRHISLPQIEALFNNIAVSFKVEKIGSSVEGRSISSIKCGTGKIHILAWSQMHGNEGTTTKAVFDLLKWLINNPTQEFIKHFLELNTLLIIPMLNPDGAHRYTRLNANGVDLNRDAQDRSQPESVVLRKVYDEFKPDFCLNLHGQRTIFGVGQPAKSSIVSFLSPAQDELRMVTHSRRRGMHIIGEMSQMLHEFIPESVGRYDDSFNINCVGDTFQQLNTPTILFEAGHFPNDYMREETRSLIFLSLVKALETIHLAENKENIDSSAYFSIPENQKCFYDFIIRQIKLPNRGVIDVAVQYEEKLIEGELHFIPRISKIGDLSGYLGHEEIQAKGDSPSQNTVNQWEEGEIIKKLFLNSKLTTTFSIKNRKNVMNNSM
tara:strand:- start:485 stop:1675 length:1191 start_codon:yes stop_codon:yes gene_type:complete